MMDRFVGAPIGSGGIRLGWTADTALAVLLKDLKAAHLKGLERNVAMPFNALSSTQLFDSMGKRSRRARSGFGRSTALARISGTGRLGAHRYR